MREGWEYKKFTDVCDVQYGYAFDSKYFTDDENAMPLIRIRDVMRGYSETFYNGTIPDGYTINEGDYLVGMDGEFNIGRWGKRAGLLNQRVCKMTSSSPLLHNQYMYYFMKVCLKSIEDETPFVTVKHLSAKRINQIKIPLPPLTTQQFIVSELDEINNLLTLKRKELETYDKLAQSLFYEMFGDPVENEKGWEVKKLGDLCRDVKYGTSKPASENGKYKYLRMCNLTYDGYLDLNDIKTIDIPDDEIEKCIVRYGDILFNRTNSLELIGKTCMFDKLEPMVIAGYIIRVRLTEELSPIVLARMFNLASIKKLLRGMAKGAVNQANINSKELTSINIPLPPLPLQQLFAQRIEAIEQQKSQVKAAIEKLETLLAARMQYWFE